MTAHAIDTMLRRLTGAHRTDRDLLEQFVTCRDEAAFAALVQRHSGMVQSVCRSVLCHRQDAEDACQATFLVLAKRATSIRNADALASWLHGVAYRIAAQAKKQAARRRVCERQAAANAESQAADDLSWREVQSILHAELQRLPEKYRLPLILCCLEGRTRDEAARQLGWTFGTLKGTLDRGRDLLRKRLERRGVTLAAALATITLTEDTMAATCAATAKSALTFASGKATSMASPTAVALAEAVLKTGITIKTGLVALLLAGLITAVAAGYHTRTSSDPATQEQKPPTVEGEVAKPKLDRFGDPLPPQAVARIGTVRWWHGHDRQGCPMVYAPDGKSLVSCDQDKGIRIVETATGKELRRIQRQSEQISCFALSPDGKSIITGSWQSPALRQWDISSGKELREIATGAKDTSVLAFSSNGEKLAAVTGQTEIRLWDVAGWKEAHQLKGHSRWIGSLVFSPDGKTLISGGGITHTIRWWDVETGREIKRLNNNSQHYWEPALSPDGKRLAAVNSPGVLYLWDATSGNEISRTELGKGGSWGCLCFSPNSEILACGDAVGRRGNQTLFFAAATGRELRRWDEVGYTSRMAFSPDGKVLAQAESGGAIRLRDAITGKSVMEAPLPNRVMSVRFTPDERTLLASCWGGQTGAWQPLTGKPRTPLKELPEGFAGPAEMLLGTALSADGKKAALVDAKGVLHVWDRETAKVCCRISEPQVGEDQADFSPDASLLVVKHVDNVIRLWDTTTGRLRCSLPKFGIMRFPHPHAFSPDGRVLATAASSQDQSGIRLWETATGKELGKLAWQDGSSPSCLAFSPAGNYLVASHGIGGKDTGIRPEDFGLRLWDLAGGRELRRFNTPAADIRAVVISPDGKTLAAGADDTVILWEMASGKERGRFPGHYEWVWSLTFSPTGRLMASGSLDHTALVWDVTGMCPDGKFITRISRPEEIERQWKMLGSEDGIRAYRAMWMMVAASRSSVSFLLEHLRPEQSVEDARLKRLIDELDSEQFEIRTRASQELEELGELAETALRKALVGGLSPEAGRRVKNLLHKLETRTLSPKQLLSLRALEVLEHIGTPEARQVLQKLTKGASEARLTQEAKAALERLAKRPDVP